MKIRFFVKENMMTLKSSCELVKKSSTNMIPLVWCRDEAMMKYTSIYSRSNLNSSVKFKSYLVIGNLTMIKTNCYNVSQTQFRPIDDRFEFCKKRKYQFHLNTDSAWELFALKNWPFLD